MGRFYLLIPFTRLSAFDASTKLSVERLFRISNILETPVNELLEMDSVSQTQNNYHNANVYQQKIEHF